jgi:parvulin-like peptidyl-prolyl isomerase
MKMSKLGLALIGAGALTAGLAGCGTQATTTAAALATVNNAPVTHKQVTEFVNGTEFMQGTSFPSTKKEQKLELKAVVAQVAVNQWVLNHHLTTTKAAKKQAQSILTSDIEAQIGSASELSGLLKEEHLTKAELTSYLTNQVIAESAFEKAVKTVKAPTTKQEEAYYKANKSSFMNSPEDEVSDILVKSKTLAATILKEAKAGTSFASLAKEYSIASNGKKGGTLGYEDVGTSMGEDLYTTLSSMKAGQFGSYHDSKGYYIVWLQATKPATEEAFSKVKSEISTDVSQNLDDQAYENFVKKLEKKDTIRYAKGW